jgi:predicted CXXCH cytochrome family protein
VLDPNTQQMMTCTSTCHRSHTAPYPYLLTLPGTGALCVNCHKEFLR